MDEMVVRSMQKWPDVPGVYGWLQLDRRGMWRLRDEGQAEDDRFSPIGNKAFREFVSRNYACDKQGRWFFQNGPQRVFVALAYTPFVFRVQGGSLSDHCERSADPLEGAWLDDEGSLILKAGGRVGVLDDRDLSSVAEEVGAGEFRLGGQSFAVGRVRTAEIEARFGFVRDPRP